MYCIQTSRKLHTRKRITGMIIYSRHLQTGHRSRGDIKNPADLCSRKSCRCNISNHCYLRIFCADAEDGKIEWRDDRITNCCVKNLCCRKTKDQEEKSKAFHSISLVNCFYDTGKGNYPYEKKCNEGNFSCGEAVRVCQG